MRTLASERGGKCLSSQYLNAHLKLEWQCDKKHRWLAKPADIKNQKSWCPECGNRKKLTIELMHNLAKLRGGKCISQQYVNNKTRIKWECAIGHQWWAKPDAIKQGRWCRECSRGFGERICRAYFELIFAKKFPNTRPKWLKNRRSHLMELDGYCEELKLAFEYQGAQHYIPTYFHRTDGDFKRRQEDDEVKRKLCKKNRICLIEIPYVFRYSELYAFIIRACKKEKIIVPKHFKRSLTELGLYLPPKKIEEMRLIASEQGGVCLSEEYFGSYEKLQFRCKEGHIWWAQPYSIKARHWCARCGRKNLQYQHRELAEGDSK